MDTNKPSAMTSMPCDDAEIQDLSSALQQSQVDAENGHYALARTLHDDLGGLLVGAIMDVGWIANQPALPENCREKLSRAQGLLKAAIDLKRELIENLRPTLLDNVGLFSTLQWHLKDRCKSAAISYTSTSCRRQNKICRPTSGSRCFAFSKKH